MKVLVAYASRYGSTRQVAEEIATTLRERGATVVLCPAGASREPATGWDLVVLGGALYSGRWHRHAHRFLKRHRAELSGTPVAVFGMGPRTDEAESWQRARAQLDRALAKRDWLKPFAVAVFGGVDPPKRAARTGELRDLRDWEAIRNWARQAASAAVGGHHPMSAG
jgi:menaquinone-dependent protoporphyrinogen oxidase